MPGYIVKPQRTPQMKDRQWRTLVKDIQNQRCILMLGPGLSMVKGEPLTEAFSKHLVSELKEESIPFEQQAVANLPYIAQRFMTIPDIRRIDLEDEAITFFKEQTKEVPEIFQLLSKLPFHLVVNTTPDNFMQKALLEEGTQQAHFLHYNFKKDRDEKIPPFSSDEVLVYNLFGSIDDPESLIFTKKERVEFIKNVVRGNPPIPHKVISEFDDRKTYLFLGFNIEDWRFPLLLDSLQIENLNSGYAPDLENYPISNITKSFFEDCYRFRFVENKVLEFVKELVGRYQEEATEEKIASTPQKAKKMVVLYSDKDESYRDEFLKHLSELERNNYLEIWHKGKIEYGSDVEEMTTTKLEEAELVCCLMSADFLSSEKIFEFEMPIILERKKEGLKIFLTLIRSSDIEEGEWKNFPILPSNKNPVNSSFWNSTDDAYQQIVQDLKNNIFV